MRVRESALTKNPSIVKALGDLEERLRAGGVLPPKAAGGVGEGLKEVTEPQMRAPGGVAATRDAERLKRLEQENASGTYALPIATPPRRARQSRMKSVSREYPPL